jgi:iron complex outermembrane recepter protein
MRGSTTMIPSASLMLAAFTFTSSSDALASPHDGDVSEQAGVQSEMTDGQGNRIVEVTVTARRRSEDLQDVPASIAAATAETLDDLNVQGVTELDAIAPGLTFVTNPGRFGSGPSIALRGVSTQTQSVGVQDSVGIVIDGVVIARAKPGSFPDLADTSRIEVLRGPQGTLFGKNASAGVISITTKDPTPDFESELSLGYGSYDQMSAHGSMSGTLVDDRLLGRVSVFSRERGGYVPGARRLCREHP